MSKQNNIVTFKGRQFKLTNYDHPEHFSDPRAEEYFEIEKNKLYKLGKSNGVAFSFKLIGTEISQSIQYILED